MDNLKKLKQTLAERTKEQIPVTVVWATAKAVDWSKKTMTATGVMDGLEYYDVLLGLGNKYVKPKTGSKCLLGLIENNAAAAFLVDCEEVETIEWNSFLGLKMAMDGEKLLINNQTESLLGLMQDVLDAILQEKHMTNMGPTISLTPDCVLSFQQLKMRFNNLLKSS